ncbi:hypothetical protein CCR85_09915 [Rhodothalassium salexigens]|uniref:iron-sulfur cluster assembly scaffold protein n=1 Tax=Rhodothalassium salexigens TaxID=1086 RepID=UPI0019124401|nr:iron-sulfur cluster assembly scaffold protein [Rhodothalassium salexigens]MBK5911802.1 hypothetical protein [Rhodothalassium salexigens]
MDDYSATLVDHALNPRNRGPLDIANAWGQAGSVRTGDALRVMLRVEGGTIVAARFETSATGPEVAAGSALTDWLIGKTVAQAATVTAEAVERLVDGLPPTERRAARVAAEALPAALRDLGRSGSDPHADQPARPPVRQPLGVAPLRPATPKAARALTPAEETAAAEAVLAQMRPTFRADGGDVALIGIDGTKVHIRLSGNCAGCQLAALTLGGVQRRLAEALGRTVRVVPALDTGPAPARPSARAAAAPRAGQSQREQGQREQGQRGQGR